MPAKAASQMTPLHKLKGVGPKTVERLARLDIHHVEDLLFHLPLHYEDRTRISPIGSLRAGDQVVIQGEVQLTEIKYARRRMLLSRISDGTGFITLRFFHFNAQQQANLARGVSIRCFGEVRRGKAGLEMTHPEFSVVNDEAINEVEENLTPIYPTTEGLHQLSLRNFSNQALQLLHDGQLSLEELLPDTLLEKFHMPAPVSAPLPAPVPGLAEALCMMHRPTPDVSTDDLNEAEHPAMQRLIIEELLAHLLSLKQLRSKMQRHHASAMHMQEKLASNFMHRLEFSLTGAQQRVIEDISADMQQSVPMQRLVQGDVGSGKTVVALLAALQAVGSGYQAAVMAPTEILAEQHFHNFSQWLEPLGIRVAWLSGKLKAAPRRQALQEIGEGEAQVIVGTHALFQDEVRFARLGLVVIDEQHRFGVHQRLALREKGKQGEHYPHQLIMTATPIPRTLSMAVYADLDCSVIDELPPGRLPVETVVMPDSRRDEIVMRVHRACQDNRQVYWVCTLIEESEVLQCQAAEDTASELSEALPDVRIGLVHGRMKPQQKEQVMQAFKAGELDLLVATTVIEVGVDVPNASLMIIENAERLGLAQLHQLRGRVGRGTQESACVLMYHGKLSDNAHARLGVMRDTNDGFVIARKDLALRGPGEVLGIRQTGLLQLRVADLQRDQALLPQVSGMADEIMRSMPQIVEPLIQRWVGQATRYASV